ncbi:hypothetical protein VSR34_22450 [Paraburkholderia sp. JHI2823]|uniref:hypothetical protein n=1 Tax=Paraburkholderia TaxID=1822464 RepID=UPI0012DF21F0|nr:hypothetical protein [Paraburkholderia mimosarum]
MDIVENGQDEAILASYSRFQRAFRHVSFGAVVQYHAFSGGASHAVNANGSREPAAAATAGKREKRVSEAGVRHSSEHMLADKG